jgi:hypothetical protein
MKPASKRGRERGNRSLDRGPKPVADAPSNPIPAPRPFKPRRGLFVFLCLLLAVWIATLLAMYFKTVYPLRHPHPTGATSHVDGRWIGV